MHSLPGDLLVAQPFEAVLFLSFLQMDKTTQLYRLYYYFSVSARAATISFGGWGSQTWLQPAFQPALRGGCAASQGRLKSRLQAELPNATYFCNWFLTRSFANVWLEAARCLQAAGRLPNPRQMENGHFDRRRHRNKTHV